MDRALERRPLLVTSSVTLHLFLSPSHFCIVGALAACVAYTSCLLRVGNAHVKYNLLLVLFSCQLFSLDFYTIFLVRKLQHHNQSALSTFLRKQYFKVLGNVFIYCFFFVWVGSAACAIHWICCGGQALSTFMKCWKCIDNATEQCIACVWYRTFLSYGLKYVIHEIKDWHALFLLVYWNWKARGRYMYINYCV